MFSYVWPMTLIIFAEVIYQICTKSVPDTIDPLASLTVTYLVAALMSGALFFALHRGGNLMSEYQHLNIAPAILGIAIVGLEAGWIYAFKAGWLSYRAHSSPSPCSPSAICSIMKRSLGTKSLALPFVWWGSSSSTDKAAGFVIAEA